MTPAMSGVRALSGPVRATTFEVRGLRCHDRPGQPSIPDTRHRLGIVLGLGPCLTKPFRLPLACRLDRLGRRGQLIRRGRAVLERACLIRDPGSGVLPGGRCGRDVTLEVADRRSRALGGFGGGIVDARMGKWPNSMRCLSMFTLRWWSRSKVASRVVMSLNTWIVWPILGISFRSTVSAARSAWSPGSRLTKTPEDLRIARVCSSWPVTLRPVADQKERRPEARVAELATFDQGRLGALERDRLRHRRVGEVAIKLGDQGRGRIVADLP